MPARAVSKQTVGVVERKSWGHRPALRTGAQLHCLGPSSRSLRVVVFLRPSHWPTAWATRYRCKDQEMPFMLETLNAPAFQMVREGLCGLPEHCHLSDILGVQPSEACQDIPFKGRENPFSVHSLLQRSTMHRKLLWSLEAMPSTPRVSICPPVG